MTVSNFRAQTTALRAVALTRKCRAASPILALLGLLVLAAPARAQRVAPASPWDAPNLLMDRARLDEIARRRAAGDPVFGAAWTQAVDEAQSRLGDAPDPVVGALKIPGFYNNPTAQQAIARRLRKDAISAYSFAMAYALTQDPVYAAKAREFVFAWVDSCTHPVDGGQPWQIITWEHRGDTPLVVEYTFPQFCGAVDLLKGAGALSLIDVARFETWLRKFVRYCEQPEPSINNHVDWQVVFLMSAGHVLGDRPLFAKAVRIYRRAFQFQIWGTGVMPFEIIRKEKAATYTLMALEAIEQAVFIGEMHGYRLRDVKSIWGGDLRDAIGYLVDFLENPASWRRHNGGKPITGPGAPGEWGWALELPYAWWDDPRYGAQLSQRPYGANPPRCYTTSHATLDFAK